MMPISKHHGMRTTLTLDEDVAAQLKSEMQRGGRSFKDTVNYFLRLGLHARERSAPVRPFVVRARELNPRPGFDFDNIAELIEQAEGPRYR